MADPNIFPRGRNSKSLDPLKCVLIFNRRIPVGVGEPVSPFVTLYAIEAIRNILKTCSAGRLPVSVSFPGRIQTDLGKASMSMNVVSFTMDEMTTTQLLLKKPKHILLNTCIGISDC